MNALSEFASFVPWLAALSALLGVVLLISSIRNLLRMLKAAELLRLPLQEIQELTFASAGPVVLCVEGPLLTRRFAYLSYKLQTDYGADVPASKHWFRAKSSGFSKARIELQTYHLPHPGRYRLHIESLGQPQPNDAEHAVVFAKPHLMATVGYILRILLASWLLIGGFVLFALSVLG